jgi:hypothetical protein
VVATNIGQITPDALPKHDSRSRVLHHERSEAYGTISAVTHPVYLVRHGQSEWNVLRSTQGQTSHPRLTSLGSSRPSEPHR